MAGKPKPMSQIGYFTDRYPPVSVQRDPPVSIDRDPPISLNRDPPISV